MNHCTCTVTSIFGVSVKKIRSYMRQVVSDHIYCGEINTTTLGEDAADNFDLYDEGGEVPEEVFELSFDVSEESR